MHILQTQNEVFFVLSISLFNVVHGVQHLVDIKIDVVVHHLKEVSDAVIHSLVNLFELVSSLHEFISVIVRLALLVHLRLSQ
jgi:hypothetical protein